MENKHFDGIVDSLMEGMEQMLSAKTVVGEPTKIGDTIIIPLVDVSNLNIRPTNNRATSYLVILY